MMKVIAMLSVAGLLVGGSASWVAAQQAHGKKGQTGQAYQQAQDAKKDPDAVFDGRKPTYVDPVKIDKSTTTPTVTPTPRGGYVPKQYQSLQTKPVPPPGQQQQQQQQQQQLRQQQEQARQQQLKQQQEQARQQQLRQQQEQARQKQEQAWQQQEQASQQQQRQQQEQARQQQQKQQARQQDRKSVV